MKMPKDLYLVRHGNSEGNQARKHHETTGDESVFSDEFLELHESQYQLTELGITQAIKAGQWFRDNGLTDFDCKLVSNFPRAMQTAAYLDIPDDEVQWMIDYNLRERDSGLFNTITPSMRDTKYALEQRFWRTQPFLNRPPQGESLADLGLRVKVILDTLARECDGKVVIAVCHGHTMRVFDMILQRFSLEQCNELSRPDNPNGRIPNGSIIHYTRQDPENPKKGLVDSFGWRRMICPAGGGEVEGPFQQIVRKKFTNAELLAEARKHR